MTIAGLSFLFFLQRELQKQGHSIRVAEEELKRILTEAEETVNHGRKRKGRMASPHSVAQGDVLVLPAGNMIGDFVFRTHTASSSHTDTEAAVSS